MNPNSSSTQATGIIGAMADEVAVLKAALEDAQVSVVSGMEFTEGTIAGNKVVAVQCGMGKVNAAMCAQTLILHFGVNRIINTGVAGTLTKELTINDFVISTEVVQHDFDVSPIGFERGEVPYTGRVVFPADEQLHAEALKAVTQAAPASKVLEGRICSGDQFVSTEAQRETILTNFGGLCCEMEGGAIAQVCYLNQVPFVIIRAISDDSNSMDFAQFMEAAARECSQTVLALCANA